MKTVFVETIPPYDRTDLQQELYRQLQYPCGIVMSRPVAVPTSSLENRVRILCAQAVAAKSEAEFRIVLPQLQTAIHDHISYLRAIAVDAIPEAFRNDANSAD